MFLDKTTEAIAHFVGLFDVTVEAGRLRKSYTEFTAKQQHDRDTTHFGGSPVSLKAPLDLEDFDPGVLYLSQPTDLVRVVHDTMVTYRPLPTKSARLADHDDDPTRSLHAAPVSRSGHGQLDPQGPIASLIHQTAVLSDEDYASVGNHGLNFHRIGDPDAQLAHLMDAAHDLSPLWGLDTAGVTDNTAALAGFIDDVAVMLRDFAVHHPSVESEGLSLFVSSDPLGQSFVNGVAVTDPLPKLDDYLKTTPEEGEGDATLPSSIRLGGDTASTGTSASGSMAHGAGASADSFVDVSAGGNTLVNTAQISNQWTAAHVMAAVGDYHQLDAIIQINVFADQDAIGTLVNGWQLADSDPTQAFNIAMFKQTDLGPPHEANLVAPGQFPTQWAITTLHGDLTIMAWVEQLSFMSDSDVAVLSSSGFRTTLSTGDNMQLNDLFLQQIGRFYDLIIVGGSIYDANIIQQTNVLLDNDLVGGVDGFHTTGQFQLSTQNNLLWNQATIHNLQGSGVVEGLPNAYGQAAANFAAGNESLPAGVMGDAMFAGMAGLRVLYVTGDFLNLQYIKQTNILGDSDQIALAMDKVKADTSAHWTVSTGSNQVINLAGITDVDFSGKIYAGGHTYSDAMLVQAEFVSSKPGFGMQNPDHLVNEAVAFLQDSSVTSPADHWTDGLSKPTIVDHHGAVDPMYSMLS
ncbi:type I secretion protein [Tianweitania sp. BSSL-BM11]|uniref:Type I secretion protein n=1 Tax=Tianweitania aestuarii TaxID=2814886 RepID=A0ABS5RZF9_9HYPH|nr:type I secretion protein [Tianweitania aestuarii]MBS9722439.1 type I secretion protein [Tianweitania aestuarii]